MNIGIDVSSYQGKVDWKKVKADGISFAILKVIRKDLKIDKQFENNWKGCMAAGMHIHGVYNYSYATTVSKAITDAKKVVEILNGRKLRVYLDVEDQCQKGLGKLLIEIINAYSGVITGAGLEFGVYTGLSFYNSYIKPFGSLDCPLWIARYGENDGSLDESYKPDVAGMVGWQFTSQAKINGINGNVDKNIWYKEMESVEETASRVETGFYNIYIGTSRQIDVVFRKIGVPDIYIGNKMKRKPIAIANGYTNYYGKASENLGLIALAKKGKLKKV